MFPLAIHRARGRRWWSRENGDNWGAVDMQVSGMMLASELRRRRVGPRYLVEAVDTVERSTWVVGDLRSTPTSMLVLAAFSLTEPRISPS